MLWIGLFFLWVANRNALMFRRSGVIVRICPRYEAARDRAAVHRFGGYRFCHLL
jgi:hypothetical protein